MPKIERLLGDVKRTDDMCFQISTKYNTELGTIDLSLKEWRPYAPDTIHIYPKDIPDVIKLLDKSYQKWLKSEPLTIDDIDPLREN